MMDWQTAHRIASEWNATLTNPDQPSASSFEIRMGSHRGKWVVELYSGNGLLIGHLVN